MLQHLPFLLGLQFRVEGVPFKSLKTVSPPSETALRKGGEKKV